MIGDLVARDAYPGSAHMGGVLMQVEYRDIPRELKFDAVSCIEMAEHVAPNHFDAYLKQVKAHLTPTVRPPSVCAAPDHRACVGGLGRMAGRV